MTAITIASLSLSSPLRAATVQSAKPEKGTAILDSGSSSGITKDAKVCVFNSAGKKVACGKVTKVTKTRALIKLPLNKKIEAGMTAEVEGASGAETAAAAPSSPTKKLIKFSLNAHYIFTLMAPASYSKISYIATTTGSKPSIWLAGDQSSLATLGFGASAFVGIGATWGLEGGGRYRIYRPFISEADYISSSASQYAKTEVTASAFGGFVQYAKLFSMTKSMFLKLGAGADFDHSALKMTATKLDDANTATADPIATATSSLNVISLRVAPSLDFYIGKIGLGAGVNLLVPLVSMGSAITADVQDTTSTAADQ